MGPENMNELVGEVTPPDDRTAGGLIEGEEAVRLVMEASGWDSTSAYIWLVDRIVGDDLSSPYRAAPDVSAYYKDEILIESAPDLLTPISDREPRFCKFEINVQEILVNNNSLERAILREPNRPSETIRLIDGPAALRLVEKIGQLSPGKAQDWLRYNLESDRVKGWDAKHARYACTEEISPNRWPPLNSFKIDSRITDSGFNLFSDFEVICMEKSSLFLALKRLSEEQGVQLSVEEAPKKKGSGGRSEGDFWRKVRFEAGAWLAYNGDEAKLGTQTKLAEFLQARAEAHGGSLGRSQALVNAKEMLEHFKWLEADRTLEE
jgi:hypothetical protein